MITLNIIFDVDGTLWDTTEIVSKAWSKAAAEIDGVDSVITAAMLKKEFGKTMDIIADHLFPDAGLIKKKLIMQKCCAYEQQALAKVTENLLYPDVKETFEKLSKAHRLFIVSNCQSGYIEMFMKKSGVERFVTDFECFGNTGNGKAENIRLVIDRNHLENTIYVGDTQGDYEASVSAGIPFIFAKYGFGNVENSDFTISGIKELLNINMKIRS